MKASANPTEKSKDKSEKNLLQRRPGANYECRVARTVNGVKKETWISTGTNIKAKAKVERTRIMGLVSEARRTGRWELVGLAKLRSDLPSIAELEEAYEHNIARESVRAPQQETRDNYWRNLKRVLRWAHGEDGEPDNELDVDAVRVAMLVAAAGENVVKDFRANWMAGVEGEDPETEASRRRSGDSMLRQARAIFGETAMRCYAAPWKDEQTQESKGGWAMPSFEAFLKTPGFGGVAPQHANITPEMLQEMAKGADDLLDANPRLYVVHLAHKLLGLRNSELEDARVGWFQAVRWEPERPVQWMMEISPRLGFKPKASEGSVPLKAEVAAELLKAWKKLGIDPSGDPQQFMVPAKHPTERHDVIYYEHAEFIRRYLPREDFSKAGYELRRWAFRRMQAKHGSREVAKAFIRHKMPADAARHYQARYYAWDALGDDLGISLVEARGGAGTMATVKVEKDPWAALPT